MLPPGHDQVPGEPSLSPSGWQGKVLSTLSVLQFERNVSRPQGSSVLLGQIGWGRKAQGVCAGPGEGVMTRELLLAMQHLEKEIRMNLADTSPQVIPIIY